jgi:hypothetical protein
MQVTAYRSTQMVVSISVEPRADLDVVGELREPVVRRGPAGPGTGDGAVRRRDRPAPTTSSPLGPVSSRR